MSYLPNVNPNIVYKYKEVLLTSSDILGLGTPFELVAAPGSGKIIIPKEIDAIMVYNSAPYATNLTFNIKVGTTQWASNTGILQATTNMERQLGISSQLPLDYNSSITISCAGNPTGGDSDITLCITYQVITP